MESPLLGSLDRLNALDDRWAAINRPLRLDRLMAPLQLDRHAAEFLASWRAGRPSDPQFEYAEASHLDASPIEAFRRDLRRDACEVESIYRRLAEDLLAMIDFVRSRDPTALTETTRRAYGAPDAWLVDRARSILDASAVPPTIEDRSIDADHAVTRLRERLRSEGFEAWDAVVESPMHAKMSVDPLRRLVKVRAGATFSPTAIDRLLVHEIGVHVRRAFNGLRQPLRLLGRGLPGYLATEEGLAAWSERKSGLLDAATMRIYAARVLATRAAIDAPFVEVFRLVEPWIGGDAAFEVACRAKRGLRDASRPGAHLKDHVYLRGLAEVSSHLDRRPDDLPLLLAAKIGLPDLPWFRRLVDQGRAEVPATPSVPGGRA